MKMETLNISPAAEGEDIVDPWTVSTSSATGIDYDKLIGLCTILFTIVFTYYHEIDNKTIFDLNLKPLRSACLHTKKRHVCIS